MNLLWGFLYLVITFSLTIVCYKFFGKIGLFIWICVSIILANIQSLKIIEIFGLTSSLGNIAYSNIYLATDILSEQYGRKSANQSVLYGFLTMLAFTGLMALSLLFIPSPYDNVNDSLTQIFMVVPRITLASLTAYLCSQFLDVYLFEKLKKKYNKLWLSNNGGTMISQIVDTIIFTLIAFAGTMPWVEVFIMMGTMYLLKFIIALCDTGFLYLAKRITPNDLKTKQSFEKQALLDFNHNVDSKDFQVNKDKICQEKDEVNKDNTENEIQEVVQTKENIKDNENIDKHNNEDNKNIKN